MADFERYYFALNANDEPIALYRMVSNDVAFAEELWQDGEWLPVSDLSEALIEGNTQYEQIAADVAKKFIGKDAEASN